MDFRMKNKLKGTQTARTMKALGIVFCSLAGYSFGEEVLPKNEEELTKGWQWVRPQEGSHRFEEGTLSLKSWPGNIWKKGKAKNILLKPLQEENVCITVKLTLQPEAHGEQAGVFLYLDDDHYCKLVKEWFGGKINDHTIVSAREIDGAGEPLKVLPFNESTVVLRMVKQGRRVVSFVKGGDEDNFLLLSATELPDKLEEEVKVALYSSGAKKDTDNWAEFHSLTIETIEATADPLSFLKP